MSSFQVAPAELEDLLLRHPDVQDSAVIGIPDEMAGELPRAFIVPKPGVAQTPEKLEEIRKFLDGMVSSIKRLRGGIEFMEAIPRNPSGKILRREIRDMVKARDAGKAKL